ncbi:hypothetical protein EES43_26725 [Streptomyces sp. ADI96-02]|nr:hypothetical protein EES43_26725 [Streptomyces sp. ADI96-02]
MWKYIRSEARPDDFTYGWMPQEEARAAFEAASMETVVNAAEPGDELVRQLEESLALALRGVFEEYPEFAGVSAEQLTEALHELAL